ncbi:butyrate kinase [Desulfonatronum thiodismutans]|uniref:butyrate kinase n=1 Tax=Desulfonatronum thiodismutans TaxID=159290 RepID=UPI0004ABE5BB|nr:butyrate kinase [Desulfonatronum thiodismutans]
MQTILTINPGSTSTKVVLFHGLEPTLSREVQHSNSELAGFSDVWSQFALRLEPILAVLDQAGVNRLDAVVGRGGLLAPLPGGVYRIDERMLEDLRLRRFGEHPCNLGAPLALEISRRFGGSALIVDPVVTDELCPEARLTGLPCIRRRSTFHALSQRGAAREAARRLGKNYENGKFIVAHLGGGVSIGAHRRGRVVDVTNALDGEGPMSPERSGTLPILPLLQLLEDGVMDLPGLRRAVLREGGLFAHLGTNDFREIEEMVQQGNAKTKTVVAAFVYTTTRHVASLLPALVTPDDPRPVDAIVLAGGLAHSELLVRDLSARLTPWGRVEVVLGLTEARVMAESALAALEGGAEVQDYVGNVF